MFEIILVGLVGAVSSFLSNISGGGGSLIMLPLLLALGVPARSAIGAIKLGGVGLVLGSAASSKNKQVIRKDYLPALVATIVVAAILGPSLSLRFSDETVKNISAVLIVVTAVTSFATWRMAAEAREVTAKSRYVGYFVYFVAVTILSGFGSGIGVLNTYILIAFLGMTPLEAISTRRIVGMFGLPLQLVLFIGTGNIDIPMGLSMLVGCTIGGFFGMRAAIRKGNEFVKRAMAIVSILLVLSLFI